MKKKIVYTFLILILLFTTSVNAAIITTTPSTVELNSNVVVKITTDSDVYGMQFTLTYDQNKFEYVTNSAQGVAVVNTTTSGVLSVSYTSQTAIDTISFTFKALQTGTANFTLGDDVVFNDAGGIAITTETFDTKTKTVTIQEASTNTGEDEAEVEELPKTGIGIGTYVILGALVLVIAVYKICKSNRNMV